MDATAIKLVIKLWHDDQPENPCDLDGWQVHSFNTRHGNYTDPTSLGFHWTDNEPSEELTAKLKAGLAFPLSYYEHGQCMWSLQSEGPQCRWDNVSFAGLLVWENDEGDLGPTTVEDRRKDAAAFINHYTLFCNGEIYGYTIEAYSKCHACGQHEEVDEDVVDFELPSCGGYYADDVSYMAECIKEAIGEAMKDCEVEFKEHAYASGLADRIKEQWEEKA